MYTIGRRGAHWIHTAATARHVHTTARCDWRERAAADQLDADAGLVVDLPRVHGLHLEQQRVELVVVGLQQSQLLVAPDLAFLHVLLCNQASVRPSPWLRLNRSLLQSYLNKLVVDVRIHALEAAGGRA